MSGKFSILVAFCVVLFGAILAGYWDMLDSEKLRSMRDEASRSVAELTGTRSDSSDAKPDAEALPKSLGVDSSSTASAGPAASSAAEPNTAGSDKTARAVPGEPASSPTREASLPQGAARTTSPSQPSVPPPPPGTPSFDILRVEPDGSAVLAGRAPPNADVRLVDGNRTIGAAKASPGGDFAIVLDDRLPAGDHQIRIEAVQENGTSRVSQETAIVSVPKPGEPGELLAMVETPNQPSRILTLPSGEPGNGPAVAAAEPGKPQPEATSQGDGATGGRQDVASLPAAPGMPPPAAGAPSPFAVEAVEIENGTVYIAGRAPGSAPVRVYIDNKLIGEDRARANGRFLVTAKVPLTVGDHRIRADMIRAGGVVASRVEVPFARPEGDAMSAIASNDATKPADGNDARDAAAVPSPPVAGAPGGAAETTQPKVAAAGDAKPAATAPAGTAGAAASAPLRDDAASAVAEAEAAPPAATDAGSDVATIQQPALEGVRARVLIRRGDTLWRISRQTYGVGRRYTVIYVANGDQIRNPNRIYPGQVFRLPKDEAPEGQDAPTAVQ